MKLWEEYLNDLVYDSRVEKEIASNRHYDFQCRAAMGEQILCSLKYGVSHKKYIFRHGPVPSTARCSWKSPFKTPRAHRSLKYRFVCKELYTDACEDYDIYVPYESVVRRRRIYTSYDDIPRGSFRESRKKGGWDKKNGRRYLSKYEKMGWSLCPKTLF